MKRIYSHGAWMLLVILSLVPAGALPAEAQQTTGKPPVVVLTRLSAPTGDGVAQKLADTITASTDLVMRLTGSLTVERADFLVPSVSFDRALEYYRQLGADGAVFGEVQPDHAGGYEVDLEVWNAAKGEAKPTLLRRTISELLSSFDLADELSLQVASTVVGRQLSDGTLVVAGVAELPHYAVYADGHLLGRDRTSFRVLTGSREVVVAKPGIVGDETLKVFHVVIAKDQTTTVSLAEPAPPSTTETQPPPPATGTASVKVQSTGTLFVDGIQKGALAAGQTLSLPNLTLGTHQFEVRYADGHLESASATFTESSRLAYISLSYVPIPAAPAVPARPIPVPVPAKPVPAPAQNPAFGYIAASYAPYGADANNNTLTSYGVTMAGYGAKGGFFGVEFRGYGTPTASSTTSIYPTTTPDEPGYDFMGMLGWGGRIANSFYGDLDFLLGFASNTADGNVYFAAGVAVGTTIRLGGIVMRVDVPVWLAPGVASSTTGSNGLGYVGVDLGLGVAF